MSDEPALVAEVSQETSAPAGGLSGLGINLNVFAAQLFNVLVIFLVLRQWAFKPLLKLLEDRRVRTAQADADAKHAARERAEAAQEREVVLRDARKDAQGVREQAVADGERLRREAAEKARADVEHAVKQGKAALVREQEQTVRDARAEMAKLAVAGAEKILRGEVDKKKAEALASDAFAKLS